jgi:hypothetical protein
MNYNCRFYFFMLTGLLLITGCDEKKPATPVLEAPKTPTLTAPFRYHKLIEVSPGQDYDILSWGRGDTTKGSFEILHSDSAAKKYTTTTGDLDGKIIEAYNSDMDLDGNPEILIQTKGKDTVNYVNMLAFEFTNGKAQKLDFPKLTTTQKQGYRGHDNFYVKDGVLMREFPLFDGNGKDAKLTTQKRLLQYGLRQNSFTVKQVSKDSVTAKGTKPGALSPVKTTVTVAKKTTDKPKKHTKEKKHKTKKHKRHRSSDEG